MPDKDKRKGKRESISARNKADEKNLALEVEN